MSPDDRPLLQVITASTRDGRKGPLVARWFLEQARRHEAFHIEPLDLREVGLPLFDEPKHPRFRDYAHEHTRRWSEIVDRADAYVAVTPEYDHLPPASLINAMQYLVQEWAYKPIGFVSYGGVSAGTRGVTVTRELVSTLKMMPMSEAVAIPFFSKHVDDDTGTFDPGAVQEKAASTMLDEMARWERALRGLREDGRRARG